MTDNELMTAIRELGETVERVDCQKSAREYLARKAKEKRTEQQCLAAWCLFGTVFSAMGWLIGVTI